jgi:MFS family permease
MEFMQSREILLWAIALGTPFFLLFGALSDKIGRKWIMMLGMLLGALCYRPIFQTFIDDTNTTSLTKNIHEPNNLAIKLQTKIIKTDTISLKQYIVTQTKSDWLLTNGFKISETRSDTLYNYITPQTALLQKDAQPSFNSKVLPDKLKWKFVLLVWLMIIFVTMVYGPVAAFLVEMFPTKIRYTSMSLPYHIGNGIFGGLVPFIATLLSVTFVNDPLVGLWYPIGIALLCFVIGTLYLSNKIDKNVND